MQGILYEETSIWLLLMITVLMGGWAAWMTGTACAETWRGLPQTLAYLVLLGCGVRFIHFALFEGTLFSPHYYLVDTVVLVLIGGTAWRAARARQMTTQYWWLYRRTGPLSWEKRAEPLLSRPGSS